MWPEKRRNPHPKRKKTVLFLKWMVCASTEIELKEIEGKIKQKSITIRAFPAILWSFGIVIAVGGSIMLYIFQTNKQFVAKYGAYTHQTEHGGSISSQYSQ